MSIVVKNICASCGKDFENSRQRYFTKGNYCEKCCGKISCLSKWRRLRYNDRSTKEEKKFLDLTRYLKTVYSVDLEENEKRFNKFIEQLNTLIKVDIQK